MAKLKYDRWNKPRLTQTKKCTGLIVVFYGLIFGLFFDLQGGHGLLTVR